MAGTTYSKFFWSDWESDPGLAQCSLAAQGLWMRMLCLAAQSDNIGFVKIAGAAASDAQIAKHARAGEELVAELIQELEANGVFSRDRHGVIYCRRMVADEKKRRSRAAGGVTAAEASLRNNKGNFTSRDTTIQQGVPATINQSPESRVQSPESIDAAGGADGKSDVLEQVNRKASLLCKVIGVRLEDSTYRNFWPTAIERMIDEGISFEAIHEAAKRLTASGMLPPNGVTSPTFFRREAISIMRRGKPSPAVALVPATKPQLSFDDWKKAFEAFVIVGAWVRSEWGPSPLEPGCAAPPEMITEARRVWEKQGNHPKSVLVGNAYKAWEPEHAKHSLIKAPTPFASRPAAAPLAS
jgi:hypothetical protein